MDLVLQSEERVGKVKMERPYTGNLEILSQGKS